MSFRRFNFRLRNGIKAFTALILATVLSVSGLEHQASALTLSNGTCAANVNVTTGVSVLAEGNYCYVAFKGTGTNYSWTPPAGVSSIDLLVVAGGGGGGSRHGSGGGAGGLLQSQNLSISPTAASITVGAGGAGGAGSNSSSNGNGGASGSPTTVSGMGITSVTAQGGGAGGYNTGGASGGSGGGSWSGTTVAQGTSGQGNSGALGTYSTSGPAFWVGGAGGGAGSAGTAASTVTAKGGLGGSGLAISWIPSTLGLGEVSNSQTYFAGGGGGGSTSNSTGGSGGIGGGSAGSTEYAVVASTIANTGGGGGGSGYSTSSGSQAGGAGAAGMVAIRYLSVAGTLTDGDCSVTLDNTTSATIASVTDYCVITLSGATTYSWTRPAAVTSVDVLVVGGGGGGGGGGYFPAASGFGGGGSGGGGGQALSSTVAVGSASYEISVGSGGGAGTPGASVGGWSGGAGGAGAASTGFGITAAAGGNGYGASRNINNSWTDGLAAEIGGTSGSGNTGGLRATGSAGSATGAGGGGGQTGVGTAGSGFNGSSGGAGLSSTLTGTAALYGAGGSGGAGGNVGAVAAAASTGFGAGGSGGRGSHDGTRVAVAGAAGTVGAVVIRYAKFHTVTYNYDGATSGNSTASAAYTRLSAGLTLPTPTKTGYFFKGWYSDGSKTQFVGVGGASYSTSSAVTLYAAWSSLVVNLDASNQTSLGTTNPTTWNSIYPATSSAVGNISGATYSNVNNVKSLALGSGKYVSFPAGTGSVPGAMTVESWINPSTLSDSVWNIIATRWFTQPDGTGGVSDWHFAIKKTAQNTYKLNLYTTSSNDVYGTATFSSTGEDKWFQVGFTISSSNQLQFFVNGLADGAAVSGVSHTQNANARLYIGDGRAAMTMAGKMSKFRLYNESLSLPDLQNNFVSEASYFGYTPITTTFNANDGSGSPATFTQQAFSATNFPLQANAFTRSGYVFTGWNTAADGSGTSYTNQQTVTLNSSTTLYAQWAGNSYTVTWDSNGGSTVSGTSSFTDPGSIPEPTAPAKAGKYFAGWSTAETSNQGNLANKIASWPYTPSAANLTLYAIWLDDNSIAFTGTGHTTAQVGINSTSVNLVPRDDSFTWEAWIYPTGFAGTGGTKWANVLDNGASGDNYGRTLLQVTDRGSGPFLQGGYFASGSDGAGVDAAANSIVLNRWQHIAMSVTRSAPTIGNCVTSGSVTVKLYVDGVLAQEASDTSFVGCTSSNGLMIGDNFNDFPQQFKGKIDQVKVWSGALTDAEVAASRTTYSTTGVDNALRAHYDFNDLAATPALNDVIDNRASSATTYNLSVVGLGSSATSYAGSSDSATVTSNVSRSQNQFNVTYDANTATSGTTTSETSLTPYTSLSTPDAGDLVRTGYSFGGWNTLSTGSGINFLESSTYQLLYGNQTLYSNWSADTYTVTYDYNSATGGTSTATSSFTSGGTAITLPVPTKTGYTLGGWFESSALTGTALATTYSPSSTRTIYAKWTANTYTVTYNYNGATGANSTVSDSFTVDGSAITVPVPTKTGYAFGGWFEASALTGSALATTYSPSSTRIIYAKWNADSNTVTFNNNGGSGSMSDQSITSGVSTALTANSLTKTGYTFAGWATTAGGSVVYADSAAATITAGLTLYAKWTANTNTVTFNANDGSGSPATTTQSITSGASTALTANSFTLTGFTFAGWNSAANGTGTAYVNSSSVTIFASATLYAQWTVNTYTVTYNKNGATGNAERASENFTTGATAITLPAVGSLAKSGYTFDGWAETNGGSKISGTYTPTASITLYARWAAGSYRITYNDNSATAGVPSASTDTYTTGGSPISLAAQSTMVRTGYTFDGWSTAINDVSTKITNSGSYTITAPVILYALWASVDYSVTYSSQGFTGGTVPTDLLDYNIGDTAGVKANIGSLVKTGYTFAGWTVSSDGSGTVLTSGDTVAIASSNVTLYPKWTANTYTVTFNLNGASGAPAGYSSGSSPFTDSFTSGTSGLTLAAVGTMVKTGYDFAGWSTTPSGGAITNTGFTTATDKTLYAVWNLKSINYTYFRGTAGGTTLTGSHIANFPTLSAQSGLYGSVINLDTTVDPTITVGADGYQFMGWNDGNSIYSKGDAFTLGSSAATFTAEWVRLYEVRYAKNGGTGVVDIDNECVQAGNTCLANQSITLHGAPNRAGYTFTGWKDQSNQAFVAGASATITSSSYLFYAQWQAINYTMAFNAQDGSASPAQLTKNISDTFTLPSPGTKTGYTFSGWFDGTNTYGVGANYTVGTASKTFVALWAANVYTVTYNWNGGVGTPVSNVDYTFGTAAITLPSGSSHTRDGYTFAGWATSQGGTAINGGFTPTGDTLLYARWVDGSYTVTLNAHGGTLSQSSYTVSRGSSMTLSEPTRTGFVFDGWYEDAAATLVAGQANTAFAPTSTATLHAKWVQNSLAGINPAHINSLTSISITGAHTWSGTHSASGTGAALSIPNDALPNGTVVKVSFIEDLSRPRNIIDSSYAYYSSVVVHWLTGTGDSATVPVTAANKPLTLTMTNPAILPGAKVFMIINGVATEAAEATQAGQVTIDITQDPEFVIAATKPSLPLSVTAGTVSGSQATVSWFAPTSTGGAPITGYSVTASPGGATCSTTSALTCDVTGLSSGVSYSYSVVADNAIGTSGGRSTTVTYIPPVAPVTPINVSPVTPVTPVTPAETSVSASPPSLTTVGEGNRTEADTPVVTEESDVAAQNGVQQEDAPAVAVPMDSDVKSSTDSTLIWLGLTGGAVVLVLVLFFWRRLRSQD